MATRPHILLSISLLLIVAITGPGRPATAAPSESAVRDELEQVGFACEDGEYGYICRWNAEGPPYFSVLLTSQGDHLTAMAFRMMPVDSSPIDTVPEPMSTAALLPSYGSDPTAVTSWLQECVGTVRPKKPRPHPLRLDEARYICTGEANAPGFSIFW